MRKKYVILCVALATGLAVTACGTNGNTAEDTTTESSVEESTPTDGPKSENGRGDGSGANNGHAPGNRQNRPDGNRPASTDRDGKGGQGGNHGQGGPGGGSSRPESYDAVQKYTIDTSITNETFSSTGTDENAIFASGGANVTLDGISLDRTSADSKGGDTASFYGVGAGILVTDGTMKISNSKITTNAGGGAGVFAYDNGVAYVSDSTIKTTEGTSGGIHVAGGGTLYASNLNVETDGGSAAAIRSDRGGGTMIVDGGSYTTNGKGSPAIYCTADIAVHDTDLRATGSEGICIEGLNTLHLFESKLVSSMKDYEQNDCTWSIIVYQSMSGDSKVGNSTFHMVGGSLDSKNGGLIYTTNTESTMLMSGVKVTAADDCEFFLRCTGNQNKRGWGKTGANGSDCHFTADAQEMKGNIVWDSISQLDLYMTNKSTLTGAVVDDESCAGDGGDGYASLYISEDSTWIVTGDSTLTNLYCSGTIKDENGKFVTIKDTNGKVLVQGDSSHTITVSKYEVTSDLSGATTAAKWSDYASKM
ncbi:MAG: hypothetical protein E7244_11750 [Enterocloster citroniae]|nr:hypothetical protein [Enterocloster citroniae]